MAKEAKKRAVGLRYNAATAEAYDVLHEQAKALGCRASDLAWHYVREGLSSPPESAPAGSRAAVGVAAGFWLIPAINDGGGLTSIQIIEVEQRSEYKQGPGCQFFRYKKDKETEEPNLKSRMRAYNQARKAAIFMSKAAGLKTADIEEQLYEYETVGDEAEE